MLVFIGRCVLVFSTRVFWALTEGATATALLVAGGEAALSALQTGAIVTGCIFTVVLGYMCAALLRVCRIIKGDIAIYPCKQP